MPFEPSFMRRLPEFKAIDEVVKLPMPGLYEVRINGTDIYYKDWGKGQPIVFSHGWPLSADDWDTQMVFFFNNGFRVIAHDRRGHGREVIGTVRAQVGALREVLPQQPVGVLVAAALPG